MADQEQQPYGTTVQIQDGTGIATRSADCACVNLWIATFVSRMSNCNFHLKVTMGLERNTNSL